jgi:ABC-type dipeptide/oligopeptide/nickel transport system ATPase component
MDLQSRLRLTYLFIAHDLRLVRHICRRVAVMYLGRIVEMGETEAIFASPAHPYTGAKAARRPGPCILSARCSAPSNRVRARGRGVIGNYESTAAFTAAATTGRTWAC